MKPAEPSEIGSNEGVFSVTDQGKSDAKLSNEPRASSLIVPNQVPVTETPREINTFEIVQKPVKSVYIDKEVKLNVQQPVKANERALESANISTIQMTEVQQPGINAYQNLPKVARSSVVQQLLRKVPTTGPPTLQVSFDSLI